MSDTAPTAGSAGPAIVSQLHRLWGWLLVEGIILIVLGALAIVVPLVAGIAVAIVLGWLLIVAGAIGLAATLRARAAPGFAWALVSALLAVAAGIALLWNPAAGLAMLTIVLTAYFIADGISNIVLAIAHRGQLTDRWEWMLVNGVVDLILAAIVIAGLPGTLAWVLGLLVGVDLVIGGAALVAMALAASRAG